MVGARSCARKRPRTPAQRAPENFLSSGYDLELTSNGAVAKVSLMDATHSAANDHSLRSLDCAAAAAHLRAALKRELGLTSRDVSVRTDRYSMGSSIDVVVRSLDARVSDVQAIANRYASVSRDSSGEILGGGNRFVDVSRDSGATKQMRDLAVEQMSAIVGDDPVSFLFSDKIALVRVGVGSYGTDEWQVWHGGKIVPCIDAANAARVAVEAYLDLSRAEMAVAS